MNNKCIAFKLKIGCGCFKYAFAGSMKRMLLRVTGCTGLFLIPAVE